MDNKITITFNSSSETKFSITSENFNILELDNSIEVNKKIQENLVVILYAYKKLIDISEKRGVIENKDKIFKKLDEILTIIG
jgi:hypothetical protein